MILFDPITFTPLPSPHQLRPRGGRGSSPWHRTLGFLILLLLAVIVAWASLNSLFHLSLHDDRYTHVLAMPVIIGRLIYVDRKAIFGQSRFFPVMVFPVIVLELISFLPEIRSSLPLSVSIFVLIVTAGFTLCYGKYAFEKAIFPLFLLILTIPIPTGVLDQAVLVLQKTTTEVTYLLLKIVGSAGVSERISALVAWRRH